ncbi:Site-specific DNA recombinase [Mucilaginibacter gossypiicola]|uniref:Site-specific DNA recombinase n=1 Tax=Mucilaginibacter gossypiicola TaxID=551995 RepID=A0A1H8ERN9_9SPHI|nr:recombinase family protein [Mucilaginibacter gossypiicola]SEN22112.1 Site-specific DNA recombinase [Mucilaginibacter gossypiicola]
MRIKYNRVSTINQSGNRFTADNDHYDLTLLDKISGSVPFEKRPNASRLIQLVESGKVDEIVIEEFSRIGRNTGDCIQVLNWLDKKGVNVIVRNVGLQSRPNGIKNPLWSMVSTVMASMYAMELENIKERTLVGRAVYVQQGGKLGRPSGSSENEKMFLEKPKSKEIAKSLKKGLTIREVSKIAGVSTKTVLKVKASLANIN